ncbi:MAG: acetolactate synthase [Clostridia bacterium]|nr:acetolactate synthase [Clostridia bacterium]
MAIIQLSTFLENVPGRLYGITKVLRENGIDIRSLCIAETTRYGVLRMIVKEPEKAAEILKENGFTVNLGKVVAVMVDDAPGGLNALLEHFEKEGLSIEYMYDFIGRAEGNKACIVIKASSNDKAEKLCLDNGFKLITSDDIKAL